MEVLSKFSNVDGIVATMGGEKAALVFAFNHSVTPDERERWKNLSNHLIEIFSLTGHTNHENEIRLVLTNTTLLIRHSGHLYVGAVVTKGHPIVKSLQRMVRRILKKMGGPVVRTDPRPTFAAPVVAAPVVAAPVVAAPESVVAPLNVPQPVTDPPGDDEGLDRNF